jgi:hypothetical protein
MTCARADDVGCCSRAGRLMAATSRTSLWDGVRNHEAKVMMRDKMKVGHKVSYPEVGSEGDMVDQRKRG